MISYVLALIIAFFLAGATPQITRVWRAGQNDEFRFEYEHRPEFWPWGSALWRASYRAMLPYVGLTAAMAVFLALPESGAFERVRTAVVWIAVGMIALMLSIALFNRPRFLVPPRLRSKPGELTRAFRSLRGDERAPSDGSR